MLRKEPILDAMAHPQVFHRMEQMKSFSIFSESSMDARVRAARPLLAPSGQAQHGLRENALYGNDLVLAHPTK